MKNLILLCLGVLLVASCKKEQPEMTKVNAGCDCAKEVSADFSISEIAAYGITNLELITETDTAFCGRNIRFEARTENAYYTWYIGSEVLNEKRVDRFFAEDLAGQAIPITLVVKKTPNTICFPADDGYDSITKYLYLSKNNGDLQPLDTTLMEGTYRMKDSHFTDSIDITIDYFYDGSQSCCHGIRIINHLNTGDTIQTDAIIYNFREVNVREKLIGNFQNRLNGKAWFKFFDETVDPWLYYDFKGRKL